MIFELTGIPQSNFQHLDDFFSTGSNAGFKENRQDFSLPNVNIRAHEWLFDGIRMAYSDWRFTTPGRLGWRYEIKKDVVTLQATIRGSVFFNGQTDPFFENRQHNLFYSHGSEISEGFVASDGLEASMFFMQFTKDAFLRLTQDATESLNRFNLSVTKGQSSILSPTNLPMLPAITGLIQSVVNCPYSDGLKRMFLLSRCIEFLVLQAELCNNETRPNYRYIKTKQDRECLDYAREYVTKNLFSPPGLSELAKIVGINEYKLKRGFKETYGTTVFGYISDARLEMARLEILSSDRPITEIAEKMGYASLQHFSAAFKKKFGNAPRHIRATSEMR